LASKINNKLKILVTGGLGYIGGIISLHLNLEGHDIFIGTHKRNIQDCLDFGRIKYMDWTSDETLKDACEEIDVIIHTAGLNSVDCSKNPIEALNVNGLNTAKLVKAAVSQKVKKIIYFSSAHVYLNPLVGEIDESSPLLNFHPYATSHLAGENVILDRIYKQEIDGCVIRLANTFGSPTNMNKACWELFVNNICKEAVQKKTITILSTGVQERNFISKTQLNLLISKLINIDSIRFLPKIYNLGNTRSYTLKEMAIIVAAKSNSLFDYYPEITFGNKFENGDQVPLNYYSKNLKVINHSVFNDIENEICKLLIYCKEFFS
jgi:UDP-glucose 4-epimerase